MSLPNGRTNGARRGRKQSPPADTGVSDVCLRERVSAAALRDLASRAPAALWRPGKGPPLRTIINDFLGQVNEGRIASVWREEDGMRALGMKGRRYSGVAHDGDPTEHAQKLIDAGINAKSIGKSMFSLPGWLRDIARCGLQDCYVLDMVNAHVVIQSRRHPLKPVVKKYVDEREAILASLPQASGASAKESRSSAKNLFIRMLYGGKPEAWCKEHGIPLDQLPPFVQAFCDEQVEMRSKDLCENADLAKRLRDPAIHDFHAHTGKHTISDQMQYVLNTAEERRVIDLAADTLAQVGVEIGAYEHDGLFIQSSTHGADELRECVEAATGYPMTVKSCREYDFHALLHEALVRAEKPDKRQQQGSRCLQDGSAETTTGPGHSEHASPPPLPAWGLADEGWEEQENLLREARTAKLTSHDLFASVLMGESRISDEIPWPLKDLFKLPRLAQDYLWYDVEHHAWVEGGKNGVSRLKEYITLMLQQRLSEYSIRDHLETPCSLRREFGNKHFREGVESCLRSKLVVGEQFHLDPSTSLRYLNFTGQAWDRDTEAWVRTAPDMLISRGTGWDFAECTNEHAMGLVDRALEIIRESQDKRGLHLPSEVPVEAAEILDEAAAFFPELRFWFDFTREWEGTIYELMHLARGLFGVLMAEALYVRGPGRNGKDTVCNVMELVGGTYVHSISCDALSQISNADSPSPTFASVRARRMVCVREVSKDADIRPEVYKKFTDPFSRMSGRDLFSHLVTFSPQHLAFFCSNGPLKIAMDNAIRQRTAIIDHVSVFNDAPVEVNDVQWVNMSERRLTEYRPGFFWLFRRVYHHLIKGRSRRNVGPVPLSSIEQKEIDCADAGAGEFKRFVATLAPALGPTNATPQCELDKLAMEACGVQEKEVSLYLSGKGFVKVRRKRNLDNIYFYQYKFEEDGVKGAAQFVKQRG